VRVRDKRLLSTHLAQQMKPSTARFCELSTGCAVFDELGRGVARATSTVSGSQQAVRQLADLVGKGRRGTAGSAARAATSRDARMSRMKPMSSMRSASVGAVCDARQVDRARTGMIEQATRRRDPRCTAAVARASTCGRGLMPPNISTVRCSR
jgi:hypothetical protein